mgnify:CR=1 FL=1
MNLPAYRVILSDGNSYITSMAAGITLAVARQYFLGMRVAYSEETEKTAPVCVAVEVAS